MTTPPPPRDVIYQLLDDADAVAYTDAVHGPLVRSLAELIRLQLEFIERQYKDNEQWRRLFKKAMGRIKEAEERATTAENAILGQIENLLDDFQQGGSS